ncbi:MAG: insulinase family protein [Bacteroidota bacterium]
MQSIQYVLRRSVFLVAAVVSLTGAATGQDLKSKLPTDPNVVIGKLDNGLTYYIRSNKKPANKVELRLVVKAGSILENENQKGLAHFMEHMNFNGTKNFKKNDLVGYLQSIGVQFGADLNAYTSFDQTVYILPIPTTKPGNLEKGFQIIEDWAHNALLTDKDIDDERGVVLEESRLGKGADDRMLKKYFPRLAEGSLYADRLPIGTDEVLKGFKYETIRSFYKDWYRPDLQAVVVVGDIDVATAKKMITQHFAGLKNPARERERLYVGVTPRKAPEAMVVTDKEATSTDLTIMFPYTKNEESTTLGDYKEDLERSLVQQMINRRLGELARSSNPPFPQAYVGFDNLVHGYESFTASASFGNEGPEQALNALTGELLRAKQFGFTESELELAKRDLMANIERAYNERATTESSRMLEEYIRNFLDNEPIPGIENENNYHKSMLPAIKLGDVNGLVGHWMANPNTFTLITAPDKGDVKLPTDKQLNDMVAKGFSQKVERTVERAVATSLMASPPPPGKIASKASEDGLGATTYTLSNGVRVTIKPTDFKSDEILMTGVKRGGSTGYDVADRSNVNFATDIVENMGVGDFTPTDLEKVMAGKNVKVDMTINDVSANISASSSVKDFESLMQLMHLYMARPRKDAALFNAYKEKQKTMLQFISSNPRAAFADTTVCALYNGNPLRRMVFPKPEDFEKMNMDRAVEIYREEFSNADGYHFFIVGNIRPDVALPLIETYLGSLPTANRVTMIKDNGVRPVKGSKELKYRKGKEKQSLIMAIYSGEAPYSEDLALKAAALAEVLNIKVIEEMREKMGAIYGGGFSASVSQFPYERFSIQMQLPCGPENVDKLLAAANQEIKNIREKGPDQKDLDKVKSQWREKNITDVKENKYWSGKLESVVFWGRNKERVTNYQNFVDKLTTEDMKNTARQMFSDNGNKFISVLYPES